MVRGGCQNNYIHSYEGLSISMQVLLFSWQNENERMSIETAKAAVDYILDTRDFFNEESVIWEFIGGEPFLEIDLIDNICDYIKTQMFVKNHHWFNSYRFNFATNGINYNSSKVQNFIKKTGLI